MKVKNVLHQPLELDFGKDGVYRINARETATIPDKLEGHPVFQRNKGNIAVIELPKVAKTDKKETTTDDTK